MDGLNEIVVALEPRLALVTNPGDVVTAVRRATLGSILQNINSSSQNYQERLTLSNISENDYESGTPNGTIL